MTLRIENAARAYLLAGFESFMELGSGTATLTVYQTNTALCVFNLAATPFTPNGSGAVAGSVPISSTGTSVAGTANRFVIRNQDDDAGMSGTISAIGGGGDIETPSLTVSAATTQTLNALVLRMAGDGALTIEGSLTFV